MVSETNQAGQIGVTNFAIDGMMMRYSLFVPRLYNFCKSQGFQAGKILPSRAFCSDESQGFPIILLTKHFGSFPFNHGQVGGIVATDRHGPHADHGKDMLIIQASHVGYDPQGEEFGVYRRLQTEQNEMSASCGKIESVIDWYITEYQFAQHNIWFEKQGDNILVTVDNQLLDNDRKEGLFLQLDKIIASDPVATFSSSKQFIAADELVNTLSNAGADLENKCPVGESLAASFFTFKRNILGDEAEGHNHLEANLLPHMPAVVTSKAPMLTAAIINTQVEFDRTFRTIAKSSHYLGKKMIFISGIHIDISPDEGQVFPLTKFIPWAAYLQDEQGNGKIIEQQELMERLVAQSVENPDQINLEDAIDQMIIAEEVVLRLP